MDNAIEYFSKALSTAGAQNKAEKLVFKTLGDYYRDQINTTSAYLLFIKKPSPRINNGNLNVKNRLEFFLATYFLLNDFIEKTLKVSHNEFYSEQELSEQAENDSRDLNSKGSQNLSFVIFSSHIGS
jgi:hypothetical protein